MKELMVNRGGGAFGVPPLVRVGRVGRTDLDAVAACFESLSAEALYRRFHSPIVHVSSTFLANLARRAELGLVRAAWVGDRVVGVAELAPSRSEPGIYEVAVVVADDWQRHGVAAALLQDVAHVAAGSQIRAHVQFDNRKALGLADHLVPRAHRHSEDAIVFEMTIPQARPRMSS